MDVLTATPQLGRPLLLHPPFDPAAFTQELVTIDFETRSAAPLGKTKRSVGAWKYSKDSTTGILCLAWHFRGVYRIFIPEEFRPAVFEEDPGLRTFAAELDELYVLVRAGHLIEAHNVGFERAIWENIMVPQYGAPPVSVFQWRDSMVRAMTMSIPGKLEHAAEAMGLLERKDTAGHAVMLQVSKPRRLRTSGLHWFEDGPRLAKVMWYCLQDVRTEVALSESLPALLPQERELWFYDQTINHRGFFVDVDMCRAAESMWEDFSRKLDEELTLLTLGEVTRGTQGERIRKWVNAVGRFPEGPSDLGLPNLDKELLESALSSSDPYRLTPTGRRVLEIRQMRSRSSVTKFSAMLDVADGDDHRIRGGYCFYGAHTGRGAGRKPQPQNYPADREHWLKGKDYDTLCLAVKTGSLDWVDFLYTEFPNGPLGAPRSRAATAMALSARGALQASPGHELIVSDFNSIEARGVLWSARDPELEFIDTAYERMGAEIFGLPLEEVTKGTRARDGGKVTVLGGGYGMGWKRLQEQAAKDYGLFLTDSESQRSIQTYRSRCAQVPVLWKDMESAAIQAVLYPGRVFSVNGLFHFQTEKFGGVEFLGMWLPSGRPIWYPKPFVAMTKKTKDRNWTKRALHYYVPKNTRFVPHSTHGGILVENSTQGLCRDLLFYRIPHLEEAGYPVVMHSHDEVVSEVPAGFGSVEEFNAILTERPAWCRDLPIKAEGWRDVRYRK